MNYVNGLTTHETHENSVHVEARELIAVAGGDGLAARCGDARYCRDDPK